MERLRKLRTANGLTQKQMACVLNIDRTTYVKYESGASEPTFAALSKLAEYFNVTTDYLLGRTDLPAAAPVETKENQLLSRQRGDNMIEIKERIKLLRKKKNLSQDAFGEKLGMTGASISRYEAGTREVTDATIKHIAKTFGISESWLRTGEGEMEEKDLLAELVAQYDLGPAGHGLLRAVAQRIAQLDESTIALLSKVFLGEQLD